MTHLDERSILYFAYGSNLHPERLGARIPSSRLLGVAQLSGYCLKFHKLGADQSAKCNALFSGDANYLLLGALFSMDAAEKPILDEIEGAGYVVTDVEVVHNGCERRAFMYVAEENYIDDNLRPFQWYKDFVYLGAQFLAFPDDYIAGSIDVEAFDDHDRERHARNEEILKRMR